MSYVNTAWLTDRHVKDLASKMDISETLAECDLAIEDRVQRVGVFVEDIPVDSNGYLTSFSLVNYAKFWLYVEILSDYWGSANGENDIYFQKLEYYTNELSKAEAEITKDNVLQNSPLKPSSSIQQVVIY